VTERRLFIRAAASSRSWGRPAVVRRPRAGLMCWADCARAERCGAVLVVAASFSLCDRPPIIELAAKHRMPSIWEWPEHVDDGGLMSYGASLNGLIQRQAELMSRLFKGAKPADLPVEQPSSVELVINLKTAKALGLTIPPALLLRADRVIE